MPKKKKKLYTVSNAHLDTQWNWTIQDTIRDCVKNTLERNIELLEKYPNYRFNFEGAFRYKLAKEYYPELYEKMKNFIAEGRWNVAGSSWDACDVNVPSSEALMRQVLYGNGYFEKEFGKKSTDIFLTDCFGFRYSLPSVEAHMGLNGFSTQKLVWGVGSPIYNDDGTVSKPMPDRKHDRMDLGKWVGPDGNYVIGSFLEGDYTYNFDNRDDDRPVQRRAEYLAAIEHNERHTGCPVRSMYYGTGDYGGSPKESSARMVDEAIREGNGLYEVISASTDQIFNELTQEEIDNLPAYDGGLLIPHGFGALTSHTINKRWNRKSELLADAAERAAVIADWMGAAEYPYDRLLFAWQTFLWHQFHDDLPGTSIGDAYMFTYNDYVIAQNMFAAELEGSMNAIISTLDTNVSGTPVAVYNPLSHSRTDTVSAILPENYKAVKVTDASGKEVPSQVSEGTVKFNVTAAPVSVAVYNVTKADAPCAVKTSLSVTENSLENARYKVSIDENGDIASVIDKQNGNRELLSAPSRLSVQPDNNTNWPSWELKYEDFELECAFVGGKPDIEILDNGPAVVSLKITRKHGSSLFTQIISLGEGSQRVDVDCDVMWYERTSLLRADFPLTVSNPKASFDLGLGVAEGENNSFSYFQNCVHQWADLTDTDGSYGVSIMNDCKYGMDKPSDNVLRLTLIHTPLGAFSGRSGQDWQDMGHNIFRYSIAGHKGYRDDTAIEAEAVNVPLIPFISDKHDGNTSEIAFASVSDNAVTIRAIKRAEKSNKITVRVQETSGKTHTGIYIKFAANVLLATETNGYETEIGDAKIDGDKIVFDMTHYSVKTFIVELKAPASDAKKPVYKTLDVPFNFKAACKYDECAALAEGEIKIPSELISKDVTSGGVPFIMGCPSSENALKCDARTFALDSDAKKLYVLAASLNGDKSVSFKAGAKTIELTVQDMFADVGHWDMIVKGTTEMIKRDEIAITYTHTHDLNGDRLYKFANIFKYTIDLDGASSITLPDDGDILVFAATEGFDVTESAPLKPLYDVAKINDKPKHTLKSTNCVGGGEYAEGALVLIRGVEYTADGEFDHWEYDGEIIANGFNCVVTMTDHDDEVKAVYRSIGENVLLNKPCSASGYNSKDEVPSNALNGSDSDKWCDDSTESIHWLEADIGEVTAINKWLVRHAGIWESRAYNTRDFRLEYKENPDDEWSVADTVEGNRMNMTVREFNTVKARYVRLYITRACGNRDTCARIYQLQVFKAPLV